METLAHAKVNLGLSVLGRRPDGYHELHTLFATVSVADRVALEPRPDGIRLEVRGRSLPTGSANLAYRAAQAYLEAAGHPGGVRIVLEKHLPIAAGLGGGSADAAAVLRGLAALYPAGVALEPIARALGADVPFLLRGGLAEGRGVGERLVWLEPLEAHLVLVNPGVPVAAAEAYRHLRPEEWGEALPVAAVRAALLAGEAPPYFNSLEAPVFRRYPEVARLKAALVRRGLRGVLMSGSGSTVFGLARDAEEARWFAARLEADFPGFWVRAARLVVPSP
ncbi:4-(cytidine 5'-diphospho)-2-C-methyl-D-erythritol kinase [Marinithermus hydrothermalis]|uniref:4-diphosphocytidyl-2-C-methyl-D-erythritol kinase n=1 Tax=Marinithermus hydrothermalis (strain DSM 14884 / JCM 11576 / T1) TaxID=869210 RepID=F2NNE1_MARHT|nr:4-(cytidine 5'-diphospho)-2-C-methyl-D-erythritol kinase [Marinithermus hydrothermalis]AEB10982.1 4-diphosphocytidyl-2-C-methyl-D-erythritolkinase [Marinithermus hydrothermalis DSM 14884]